MDEQSNAIDEVASDWLIRRESGQWTDSDQQRFENWLNASTLNRVAFLRLDLAWEEAARLKALGAGVDGDQPPPSGQWVLTPFFETSPQAVSPPRRRAPFFAVAAIMLVVIGIGAYVAFVSLDDRYSTPVGGLATVPMGDGSKVTLNTNTRIEFALTDTERRVDLQQGEAFFDVSRDPTRPFVVQAGSKRIVAVGTKFSVRRNRDEVQVVVTEGKVRVEEGSPRRVASVPAGSAEVFLTPGSIARAGDAGVLVQRKSVAEAEEQLSWRDGILRFRNHNLSDAISEFNRYNERQIVLDDPAVAALKIEGNFRATNVDAFVRLLESGFPVRASVDQNQIVLNSR